jgi:hypothetical protein
MLVCGYASVCCAKLWCCSSDLLDCGKVTPFTACRCLYNVPVCNCYNCLHIKHRAASPVSHGVAGSSSLTFVAWSLLTGATFLLFCCCCRLFVINLVCSNLSEFYIMRVVKLCVQTAWYVYLDIVNGSGWHRYVVLLFKALAGVCCGNWVFNWDVYTYLSVIIVTSSCHINMVMYTNYVAL